jgi:hypothetical protein
LIELSIYCGKVKLGGESDWRAGLDGNRIAHIVFVLLNECVKVGSIGEVVTNAHVVLKTEF